MGSKNPRKRGKTVKKKEEEVLPEQPPTITSRTVGISPAALFPTGIGAMSEKNRRLILPRVSYSESNKHYS